MIDLEGEIGGSCRIRTCDQLVKSHSARILYLVVIKRFLFMAFPTLPQFLASFALVFAGVQTFPGLIVGKDFHGSKPSEACTKPSPPSSFTV